MKLAKFALVIALGFGARMDADPTDSIYLIDGGTEGFTIPAPITGASASTPFVGGDIVLFSEKSEFDEEGARYAYVVSSTVRQLRLALSASNHCFAIVAGCDVFGNLGMLLVTTDTIRVGVPSGKLRISFLFEGGILIRGQNPQDFASAYYSINQEQPAVATGPIVNEGTYEFPIVNGEVGLTQQLGLTVVCESQANQDCIGSANFFDTAMVGGAVVVDSNGNIIPGVTITSDSGSDYTQPLPSLTTPEPRTFGFLIVGLAVLAIGARRRASPNFE